jgi:hypothetical protein
MAGDAEPLSLAGKVAGALAEGVEGTAEPLPAVIARPLAPAKPVHGMALRSFGFSPTSRIAAFRAFLVRSRSNHHRIGGGSRCFKHLMRPLQPGHRASRWSELPAPRSHRNSARTAPSHRGQAIKGSGGKGGSSVSVLVS